MRPASDSRVVRQRYSRGTLVGDAFAYVHDAEMEVDHVFRVTLTSGIVVTGAPEPYESQSTGVLDFGDGLLIASAHIAMIEVMRGSEAI